MRKYIYIYIYNNTIVQYQYTYIYIFSKNNKCFKIFEKYMCTIYIYIYKTDFQSFYKL